MKKILKFIAWTLAFTVTLVVLFYAEENWRGARAWRKTAAELRAKGYPLTISEIIPPPVADDDNIAAAPIFAELFNADGGENFSARLFMKNFHDAKKWASVLDKQNALPNMARGEPGDLRLLADPPNETLTVRQTAVELLSNFDQVWTPLLAEVHAALLRPQCRWPLAYERGIEMPIHHLTSISALMKALRLRAACYLAIGETSKAAADLDDVFKLAQAGEGDTGMMGCIIAYIGRNAALSVFWRGLVDGQWREDDLTRLQQTFAAHNEIETMRQAVIREQTTMLAVNFAGQLPLILTVVDHPNRMQKIMATIPGVIPSGLMLSDKSCYAELMQSNLSAIDTHNKTVSVPLLKSNEERVARLNDFFNPFTKLALPSFSAMIMHMAKSEAYCRQAILACALERYRLRHGKLPLTLSELTPDFIEKIPNQVTVSDPMIYRRVSDSDYILYSIGWNLRDDGGTISDDKRADQLDWVWASKPELYQRKKVTVSGGD